MYSVSITAGPDTFMSTTSSNMLIRGDFVHTPQLGTLDILEDHLLSIFSVSALQSYTFQSTNHSRTDLSLLLVSSNRLSL